MQQDSLLAFGLPAVAGKKNTAAFDGGYEDADDRNALRDDPTFNQHR